MMASFIRLGSRFLNLDLITDASAFWAEVSVDEETGVSTYVPASAGPEAVRAVELCFLSPAPSLTIYAEEAVLLLSLFNLLAPPADKEIKRLKNR